MLVCIYKSLRPKVGKDTMETTRNFGGLIQQGMSLKKWRAIEAPFRATVPPLSLTLRLPPTEGSWLLLNWVWGQGRTNSSTLLADGESHRLLTWGENNTQWVSCCHCRVCHLNIYLLKKLLQCIWLLCIRNNGGKKCSHSLNSRTSHKRTRHRK